jgi:hypothetical protein
MNVLTPRPLDILVDTSNYLQCTTTGDASDPSRVDLFALNSYSWCGDSSYTTSSYNDLVSDFSNTTVPVFFSEYGCNVPAPRVFTEVPVIYGPLMTPVLSGGVVYGTSNSLCLLPLERPLCLREHVLRLYSYF